MRGVQSKYGYCWRIHQTHTIVSVTARPSAKRILTSNRTIPANVNIIHRRNRTDDRGATASREVLLRP